ncbi:alpha-L-fucosidase [Radiobacillus sp. PE A8.2]|uniref:alpha-L-fucosidase n=1 Tax=Radiobacillus sp. PE A8.2 TaxID=3380349 RepID=UPI003891176C
MDTNSLEQIRERSQSFLQDRFGMFIHWGLYAIPSRGEWVRSLEKMTLEDYQVYFDEFNPIEYDPRSWAKAAKNAGMKYAVLTAKHHDGFCLFDSELTDYKSTNTKASRDLVREFIDAFRAEGLKVGLYYSLLDWHHPDYPAYEDKFHPMRDNPEFKREKSQISRYVDYMHGQVRELLTNYGKIDIMFFDFAYEEMIGETWKSTELTKMIRSLQPHIIINSRLESSGEETGSIYTKEPTFYSGDYASPEQMIPPGGVMNENGESIPWEANITLNNNWGYVASDRTYKSAKTIIRKLVECVSKNGNLLLNVGPDAKGKIPQESLTILTEVGEWLSRNGESIYGCGDASLPKPEWGRYTRNGDRLYAHVFEECIGAINMPELAGHVKHGRLLSDGSEVSVFRPWNTTMYPNDAFVSLDKPEHHTYPLPDKRDTVIQLTLKK